MKTYLSLIVIAALFLGACSTQKDAGFAYDDVYYSSSPDDAKKRSNE
jgi:PBP1b-binding outer membrane lipoprotein LpoB